MTRPDREPPGEFAKAAVQGVGMLALMTVGIAVLSGLRSGAIVPTEVVATASAWWATATALAPTVAAWTLGTLAALAVLVVAIRHRRAGVRAWLAAWWRYRRHWDTAMAAHGLTVTEALPASSSRKAAKVVRVPRLRGIEAAGAADVLTVSLPAGQTPVDWYQRTGALAQTFGVATVRVQLPSRRGGKTDIDLVLERGTRSLALPAGRSLDPSAKVLRPATVGLRAWSLSLRILSARFAVPGSIDTYRRILGVRFEWGVVR